MMQYRVKKTTYNTDTCTYTPEVFVENEYHTLGYEGAIITTFQSSAGKEWNTSKQATDVIDKFVIQQTEIPSGPIIEYLLYSA